MFPVDFVVLDMDEDNDVPLILGRPFLETTRSIIDVGIGELTFHVGDDTIILKAHDSVKMSSDRDDITSHFDVSNITTQLSVQEVPRKDMIEPGQTHSIPKKRLLKNKDYRLRN